MDYRAKRKRAARRASKSAPVVVRRSENRPALARREIHVPKRVALPTVVRSSAPVVRDAVPSRPSIARVMAPAAIAAPVVSRRPSRATQHLRASKPVSLHPVERAMRPAAVASVRRNPPGRISVPAGSVSVAAASMSPARSSSSSSLHQPKRAVVPAVVPARNSPVSAALSASPLHSSKDKKDNSDTPRDGGLTVCKERPKNNRPSAGRGGSRSFIPWCS